MKLVKKTVKKGKGRPKTVTKEEPVESFFRYFESNKIPSEEEVAEMEQEEAMEVRGSAHGSGGLSAQPQAPPALPAAPHSSHAAV